MDLVMLEPKDYEEAGTIWNGRRMSEPYGHEEDDALSNDWSSLHRPERSKKHTGIVHRLHGASHPSWDRPFRWDFPYNTVIFQLVDCFIIAVMGQRLEPYVSSSTKFQTDSTGFTLESVIHIGCYLITATMNPQDFVIVFYCASNGRGDEDLCQEGGCAPLRRWWSHLLRFV